MLDQELKQAYQKITPSSELEHKILAMCEQPQKRKQGSVLSFKPIMTVAACLVLLLGSVTVTSYLQRAGQTDILLQEGITLDDHASHFTPEIVDYVTSAMPRAASMEPAAYTLKQTGAAIDLHISSKKEVLLTVDEGILYIVSKEDGAETVTDAGQNLTVTAEKGETAVRWVIPTSDLDGEYRMTVGKEVICVTYHAQTDEYWISRTDAEN